MFPEAAEDVLDKLAVRARERDGPPPYDRAISREQPNGVGKVGCPGNDGWSRLAPPILLGRHARYVLFSAVTGGRPRDARVVAR